MNVILNHVFKLSLLSYFNFFFDEFSGISSSFLKAKPYKNDPEILAMTNLVR